LQAVQTGLHLAEGRGFVAKGVNRSPLHAALASNSNGA